jgi:hypothetical protein
VDQDIFKAILEPLIVDPLIEVFKKQRLDAQHALENFEDEKLLDTVIVPVNRCCK